MKTISMKTLSALAVAAAGLNLVVLLGGAYAGSRSAEDLRVTVIGCVHRSEKPAPPAAGAPSAIEESTTYVLSDITLAEDPKGRAPSTREQLLAQTLKSYRLDNANASLVAPHVGDRVEVTGTVVGSSPVPTQPPAPLTAPVAAPKLRVESVRMISSKSATCLP